MRYRTTGAGVRLGSAPALAALFACSSSGGAGGGPGPIDASAGDAVADAQAATDGALEDSPADGGAMTDASARDAPGEAAVDGSPAADSGRDALGQPFASTSIWNMPIGSSAVYVAAGIRPATGTTLETDGDILVLTPGAPSTEIHINTADWDNTRSRCPTDGGLLWSAPIPAGFVVDTPVGQTPNAGLAVLLADRRTIKQTQPFARCAAGQAATSHYAFPDQDLYGPGITGAHGGSGLSAIGGTLRLGELRPHGDPPRHVLKLELNAAADYYNDGKQADCYRWPAVACDGYFNQGTLKYGGTNPALRPGSLLGLPPSVPIASLKLATQAATQLAWTLQNYGAYLVDDTAWSATSICVEQGPAGNFVDQFKSDWGFPMDTAGTKGAFAADIATLVSKLSVVDNNAASSVGGGGTPLQPLAPPIVP